jgi:hypothetical protein
MKVERFWVWDRLTKKRVEGPFAYEATANMRADAANRGCTMLPFFKGKPRFSVRKETKEVEG